MDHGVRLHMTAVCADEYFVLQIKGTVGWLNLLEPQFTTAEVAARRGRRLDKFAHVVSFRPTCFGARERNTQKGLSSKAKLKARTLCVGVSGKITMGLFRAGVEQNAERRTRTTTAGLL
jgi:hypothetical protein